MDKNGVRQRITHGWNAKEVQIERWYCDGHALVDGRQVIFEYNGCAYHSCEQCRTTRINKNDEEPRKRFFSSLPNTTLVTTSSCEWYEEKLTLRNFKPEISPLLWHKEAHSSEILKLIGKDEVYGFLVVDIARGHGSQKWLDVNWPPIFQKTEITYEDLPTWMQSSYEPNEFPKQQIVQSMHAKNLLLHTSLVKFYISNGFHVSKIHKFYEYEGARCFAKVFNTVYEARVQATETHDDMKATAVKLVSNSMYGSTLLVSQLLISLSHKSI